MRWFKNRTYKSGTRWCFWRWTDVRSQYIVRLHLLKTPWFAICLHWILKPDPEPWLHDHPVSFLSLILRGKYAELRRKPNSKVGIVVHRWFNFLWASREDRHRIIFTRKNTLTLCFMGPVTRTWGYHTDDGWIPWKVYEAQKKARAEAALWRTVERLRELENTHDPNDAYAPDMNEYNYLDMRRERLRRFEEQHKENEARDRHDVIIDVEPES